MNSRNNQIMTFRIRFQKEIAILDNTEKNCLRIINKDKPTSLS